MRRKRERRKRERRERERRDRERRERQFQTKNNYMIALEGANDITYGSIYLFINTQKNVVIVDMQL